MENLENKENLEINQEQQDNFEQPNEQKIEMDINQLKQWLVTDEGKKFMQPLLDKHFTKSLETWKKNNLDALVQEKYNELHPTDPKEQEILRLKKELAQKQIQEETIKMLEEAEIPVSFSEYFKSDNLETTQETIKTFVEHFNQAVNKEVTNRLKGWGSTPKDFGRYRPSITKADLKDMTYEQRVQLYNSGYQHLFR
jgi:hypothetical protein